MTIHYAKQSKHPIYFLKLNFSKAYDKVDLNFLFKALEGMGFLPSFVHMFKMLFKNTMVQVSVNSQTTDAFKFNKELDRGASMLHISSSLLASSSTFPSKEK
jgi:hypothetical protein